MTESSTGNAEEERRADFYTEQWSYEAVSRYFYNKVQQKRAELEQALGIRNPWSISHETIEHGLTEKFSFLLVFHVVYQCI